MTNFIFTHDKSSAFSLNGYRYNYRCIIDELIHENASFQSKHWLSRFRVDCDGNESMACTETIFIVINIIIIIIIIIINISSKSFMQIIAHNMQCILNLDTINLHYSNNSV